MKFNIFANTGNWDSDCIGYVATVEADDAGAAMQQYASTLEYAPETLACTPPSEDMDELSALLNELEMNEYFEGPVTHWMSIGVSNPDFMIVLQAAPV